ncbi:hypothetical protein BS50DRAFT_637344 [Corynespora cassiicola Philippines]|uniref:DJ-1/PfpI domain-containing protein n=1 Tax=Corynespora cassiicola Philippines TaxID=1448308 RepID=A0A2T2NG76_CORCC|nr:hypothetical protein BS50DRAFT_637344 [Corynespora cassiicola Philippines]
MPATPRGYTSFPSQADLFYFCTTSSTSEEDLNLHYAPPSKSSIRVGIVILGQDQIQLLDLAAVDLLSTIGRNRIAKLNAPALALDESVDEIDIRYVSPSGEGSFSITSGARMPVTNSFENAPQFDVILIPGTFSSSQLPPSAISFLAAQISNPELLAVMTVSSGILNLVQTGLPDRKRAAAPSCLLPGLRQRYPATSWQQAPWTRHGNFWSSSSPITALDMVTAWMREYFWDRGDAVEYALTAAGVAPLDEYDG